MHASCSMSHYRLLMRVSDEQARSFYAEECARDAWSVRQLERQVHTMYYLRILASRTASFFQKPILTVLAGMGFLLNEYFILREKRWSGAVYFACIARVICRMACFCSGVRKTQWSNSSFKSGVSSTMSRSAKNCASEM